MAGPPQKSTQSALLSCPASACRSGSVDASTITHLAPQNIGAVVQASDAESASGAEASPMSEIGPAASELTQAHASGFQGALDGQGRGRQLLLSRAPQARPIIEMGKLTVARTTCCRSPRR